MNTGSPDIFDAITIGTQFRAKNRIFRSSISGRFDNYDGSGTPVRVHWAIASTLRKRAISNRGHLFGVDLPNEEKRALLEYLKQL
jgi:hypothetical protein